MTIGTICKPDCPNRSATCHAECEIYLAAWAENKRRYEEMAKQRRLQEIIDRSVRENRRKTGKKTPKY